MPEVRSLSLGVYVGVGGRDEPAELAGVSHFLEHLLFKGTHHRSAQEIAASVDAVGGEMNAFTSREHTAFYVRLPSSELDFAVSLLADVIAAPAFRDDEIESERHVILEELLQSEDEPDERAHSLCMEALFPGHPLGRDVLGSEQTIEAMDRTDISAFHRDRYQPASLVVVAAGDVEHASLVRLVEQRFAARTGSAPVTSRTAPAGPVVPVSVLRRATEQAHLTVGWRTFPLDDPDRYPLAVLNHVLGAGMSSRLFQEIRERRGLAYSVYSYTSLYSDAGALMVYAGCAPTRLVEVRSLIDDEVGRLCAEGITADELRVAKGYLRGSMPLSLEDSGSRMARLGSSMVSRGAVTDLDTQLARIEAVDRSDVQRVIDRVLTDASSSAAVGPLDERDLS
jgi:predicted Zn-dependent peptidase